METVKTSARRRRSDNKPPVAESAPVTTKPDTTTDPDAVTNAETVTDTEQVSHPPASRPGPEAIAARAYDLYLERGAQHGSDVEDWLQAERELTPRPERPSDTEHVTRPSDDE